MGVATFFQEKTRVGIDFSKVKCYTITNITIFGGNTMKKKIKYWLAFIGTKNLIAISALVIVVAAIAIGVAVSNNKKGKEADKIRY